jgi:transcriptional regulator with XRE-family HTH domain
MRSNLPRAVRLLRLDRGWRQRDLGDRIGVSRELVSRIERGDISAVPLRSIERIAEALGGTLDLRLHWRGEQLDRLLDAKHASLQDALARAVASGGWTAKVEFSFNHFGDRGRVDVLAFHEALRFLLVAEVKSAVGDLQETIGRLHVKSRLGGHLAREAGWGRPDAVVPALVIGDSRAARRVVARHPAMFAAFPLRGRQAVAWVQQPTAGAPSGLLWFATRPDSHRETVTHRVRAGNRPDSHGA